MTPKHALVASLVLFVSAAAGGQDQALQKRTIQLNSDLTAQVLVMGRDNTGRKLSASVKISNTGEKTIYVLLAGKPTAMDEDGGQQFTFQNVTGIAFCQWDDNRVCVGIPDSQIGRAFPLAGYTRIDAGRSAIVVFTFGLFHADPSTSKFLTLSAEVGYRVVESEASDAELSDRQKLKTVHLGSLSFEKVPVREK
jgi:hypothetical protein